MTEADSAPFLLPGDERGVLLVHGFAGSPWIWRMVAEKLAARGFTVAAPRLAGHQGTVKALNGTRWRDWAAGVDHALADLRRRCRRLAVCGLSLGGLLALHAGHNHPDLAAVASLGAPLWLPYYVTLPARALAFLRVPAIPKGPPDVRDPQMRGKIPSFPAFPVRALASLIELMAVVRRELPEIKVPTFVSHGDQDRTAPPACALEIMEKIGTRDARFLPLSRSGHLITVDVEHQTLAAALGTFLEERMPLR